MGSVQLTALARILRPGHVLSHDDVLALLEAIEPPWRARMRRKAVMAAAVRDAMGLLSGRSVTNRAAELERLLRRYEGVAWRRERHLEVLPEDATKLQSALHRILRLSGGAVRGWETFANHWREADLGRNNCDLSQDYLQSSE